MYQGTPSGVPLATANRAALAAALGVQGLKAPLARSPSACPDAPPVERAWKPRRKLNFEFDPRCPAEDMGKHHPEARGWFRVVGPGEGVLARSVGEKLTQVKFQTASLLDQGGGRGSLNETKYWLRPYSRNFSVPQVVGRLKTILDELAPDFTPTCDRMEVSPFQSRLRTIGCGQQTTDHWQLPKDFHNAQTLYS